MIPASGSAYTYSYVVLGEIIAWVGRLEPDPGIFAGGQRRRGRAGPAMRWGSWARVGVHLPAAIAQPASGPAA